MTFSSLCCRVRECAGILICCSCILYGGLGSCCANAQTPAPFSRIAVSTGGLRHVNDTYFHRYWTPGPGGEVRVSTPFYIGNVFAGATASRYAPATSGVPGFLGIFAYAGWEYGFRPLPRVTLSAGGRVGNLRMSFDEFTFEGDRNESEMTAAASARLQVRIVDGVSAYVAGTYMKTFTFVRLQFAYASAGLSFQFNTPEWLRDLLL